MRRIIFLGIDGVIGRTGCAQSMMGPTRTEGDAVGSLLDRRCVRNLGRIVDRTGADIVVISSCADTEYEDLLRNWKNLGLPGFLTDVICVDDQDFYEATASWLRMYGEACGDDDVRHVILDCRWDPTDDRLVTIDPGRGLYPADAMRAIDILSGEGSDKDRTARKEELVNAFKPLATEAARVLLKISAAMIAVIAVISILAGIRNRHVGDFTSERKDILQRREYLKRKLLVKPEKLLREMPAAVGEQFQGEWALYSCSMYTASLVNISRLYPETRAENAQIVDSLIRMVMSKELRHYDAERWGEDPLETLGGDNSHVSYLSHLSWMMSGYREISDDMRYDAMNSRICDAMNRRMLKSSTYNIPTYPGELIYVPDMLVAVVALSEYSRLHHGEYSSTVDKWLRMMKDNLIDERTGLVPSAIDDEVEHNWRRVTGSYTALSCYYLTLVDPEFARDQYNRICDLFIQRWPLAGMKEYHDRRCLLGFDIDAGPIIMNLSPSGTAFVLGPVTYFGDMKLRKRILKTAEIAGTSWRHAGRRHYLLADVALVGEAIALAMRTAGPGEKN